MSSNVTAVPQRAGSRMLQRAGFANVYNLEGGIEAWSRDVDPPFRDIRRTTKERRFQTAIRSGALETSLLTRLVNCGASASALGTSFHRLTNWPRSSKRKPRILSRSARDQLRDSLSVEIRHGENIGTRIAVKMPGGVNFLQLFRFHIQPVPDDRHGDPAKRLDDLLLKVHHVIAGTLGRPDAGVKISPRPFVLFARPSESRP